MPHMWATSWSGDADYEISRRGGRDRPRTGASLLAGCGGLDRRHEAPADVVGLVVRGRLDHHADPPLRPAPAHETPAPALELPGGGGDGVARRRAVVQGRLRLEPDVDENLRELLHGAALGEVAVADRLEGEERGGGAVPARREPEIDDVARLLAPSAQPRRRSSLST